MTNQKEQTISVWFSCGAASAVAAKKTIEKYSSTHNIRILNTPVAEEHHDNQRFLKDVEKWLGLPIERVTNPKYPESSCYEIWDKGFMANRFGAVCTKVLKKEARQIWEKSNKSDYLVLGFTAEERQRHDRFVKGERDSLLPVLIEARITKQMCFDVLKEANIDLPEIYKLGYPNANCIGCVKASSSTYWNLTRKLFPDEFERRAEQSRRIGSKLVWHKGKRIYLDELLENAKGRTLKNYNTECGIFCEESK